MKMMIPIDMILTIFSKILSETVMVIATITITMVLIMIVAIIVTRIITVTKKIT